jgi:hypothetical protein
MTTASLAEEDSEIPRMAATLYSYERFFGPYHPQTLDLTTVLAKALLESGHQELGRRLLERAVGDLTKHLVRFHPVRLRALELWLALLCKERDWPRAVMVQRELLDWRLDLFGADHPEAAAAQENLRAITTSLLHSSAGVPA